MKPEEKKTVAITDLQLATVITYTDLKGVLYALRWTDPKNPTETKFPAVLSPIEVEDVNGHIEFVRDYAATDADKAGILDLEDEIINKEAPTYPIGKEEFDEQGNVVFHYNIHLGKKSAAEIVALKKGIRKQDEYEFVEAKKIEHPVIQELIQFEAQQKPNLDRPVIVETSAKDANCLLHSLLLWLVVQSKHGDKATRTYINDPKRVESFLYALNFVIPDSKKSDGEIKRLADLAKLSTSDMQEYGGQVLRIMLQGLLQQEDIKAQHRLRLEEPLLVAFDKHPEQDWANDLFEGTGLKFIKDKFTALKGDITEQIEKLKAEILALEAENRIEHQEQITAKKTEIAEKTKQIEEKKAELLVWWKTEGHNKYVEHIVKPKTFLGGPEMAILVKALELNSSFMQRDSTRLTSASEQRLNRPTVMSHHSGIGHWRAYLEELLVKQYNAEAKDEAHQLTYELDKTVMESVAAKGRGGFSTQEYLARVRNFYRNLEKETAWATYQPVSSNEKASEASQPVQFTLETTPTKEHAGKFVLTSRVRVLGESKKTSEENKNEQPYEELRITASEYRPADGEDELTDEETKKLEILKLQNIARAHADAFKLLGIPEHKKLDVKLTHIGGTWKDEEAIEAYKKAGFKRISIDGDLVYDHKKSAENEKEDPDTQTESKELEEQKPLAILKRMGKTTLQPFNTLDKKQALAAFSTVVGGMVAYSFGGTGEGPDFADIGQWVFATLATAGLSIGTVGSVIEKKQLSQQGRELLTSASSGVIARVSVAAAAASFWGLNILSGQTAMGIVQTTAYLPQMIEHAKACRASGMALNERLNNGFALLNFVMLTLLPLSKVDIFGFGIVPVIILASLLVAKVDSSKLIDWLVGKLGRGAGTKNIIECARTVLLTGVTVTLLPISTWYAMAGSAISSMSVSGVYSMLASSAPDFLLKGRNLMGTVGKLASEYPVKIGLSFLGGGVVARGLFLANRGNSDKASEPPEPVDAKSAGMVVSTMSGFLQGVERGMSTAASLSMWALWGVLEKAQDTIVNVTDKYVLPSVALA